MNIYQGDQTEIAIKLTDSGGDVITDEAVSKVVVSLGDVIHSTTDEENPITYDPDTKEWVFILSQEDTLAMRMGVKPLQARVKFTDDIVSSADIATVFILPSQSTEVL